ncbi:hypothetical protein BTM25_14920 [Actinomadura rubteroloni]|uniref:Uncharacterized protein n=1 Tax=Actinomadura rubteroloni TaxID=1926885 RepID=A0A2P4UPW1_9ACTN|nr:hypothetical protein [Actinomadura rubteroloni]POM27083.1 hypothetical protein BTM25_14920 [Actinomadura rubteroloni]
MIALLEPRDAGPLAFEALADVPDEAPEFPSGGCAICRRAAA